LRPPGAWRIALVGCGRIAETAHVPAFHQLADRVTVEAVCDPVAEHRDRLGSALGLGPDRRFADVRALLERALVDAVDVAVPHEAHEEIVLAACDARKHVLCEVPLAPSLAEADRILEAAETAGIRLGALHSYRYQPAFRRAIWLVHGGAIGIPFSLRAEVLLGASPEAGAGSAPDWRLDRRRSGGGCLLDSGYHYVYLARELMGSDVLRVCAMTGTFTRAIDVEDHALLLLRHRNGGISSVATSWSMHAPAIRRVEVHGSEGVLSIGESDDRPLRLYRRDHGAWEYPDVEPGNEFALAIGEFLDALDAGEPPPVCGEEARRNLRIILAAYESSRAGTVVTVP
jgi:predicted dehydrogenase